MATSSDFLQLGYVKEATPGVTPANPVLQLARVTGESLAFTPATQLSNELNPQRAVVDVIVSGGNSGGDIQFELSKSKFFDDWLAAVLCNVWGATNANQLELDGLLQTFTTEKRFTLDQVGPVYDFHRIVRTIFDSMQLTFAPAGPATGSVTIIGGQYFRTDDLLAGETYTPAETTPVMVGSGVRPIIVTIDGTDYDTWCFGNLTVNMRNNGRAIECLGTVGAAEMALGRFECEITANILVRADTPAMFDAFLLNKELGFKFSVEDADDPANVYTFIFPRCRVQTATQVAGGTGQDVVMAVTLQALLPGNTNTLNANSPVIVTYAAVPAAP